MKTEIKFLLGLSLFIVLTACSGDDGGDEGDGEMHLLGAKIQSKNQAYCSETKQLRMQCYQDLLNRDDRIMVDLEGANPFLLKSWDQIDVSKSVFMKQIQYCRDQFKSCAR